MMKSALALQNLQEYISYCMEISNWERHCFNNIEVIYNGYWESVFNYVFCKDNVEKDEVVEVLQFLKEKGWEMTWPVDAHMHNLRSILEKLNVSHASVPKKAFLDINNFIESDDAKQVSNLELVRVNTDQLVQKYDHATSEIFYHDTGIVTKLLRGVPGNDTQKLQFFLGKIDDQYVGTCALYMGSESVGFYADGVFRGCRQQGIASSMIMKKIAIAKEYGYQYVIAHCMKQSINLYTRLGFKMLGNLRLYISSPKDNIV